jgi:hypothetical protein
MEIKLGLITITVDDDIVAKVTEATVSAIAALENAVDGMTVTFGDVADAILDQVYPEPNPKVEPKDKTKE